MFIRTLVVSMILMGTLLAQDVSAYLYANYKNSDTVYDALKANGFEIIGEYDLMNNEDLHMMVFTNKGLKEAASHPERGFAAVEKVLVSKKHHQLIFTNPEYFMHAFLQNNYNEEIARNARLSLLKGFGTLQNSDAKLDKDDIAEYHFLMGMPYYEDMQVLAKGSNLLEQLEQNAGDNIVFKLELSHSTLIGIDVLDALGENEFLSKIKGQRHAAFLPYMILLENNTAKILHPKYYIAISYPELTMREFVNISDAPDNIYNYLNALVK